MSSKSRSKEQEQEQWLQRRRKLWHIEQEQNKLHEIRKSQKIEEFERKRALKLNINKTQKSPQREQEITSIENKSSKKLEDSTTTINKKDLQLIKVKILHGDRTISNNKANQNVSKALNTSIISINDIVISRRPDEGSRPIFSREEIKEGWTKLKKVDIVKKENKPTVMQNTKSDNQCRTSMSADRKNADFCKRDDETVHCPLSTDYRSHSCNKHQDNETNNHNRHEKDKNKSSSTRKSSDSIISADDLSYRGSTRSTSKSSSANGNIKEKEINDKTKSSFGRHDSYRCQEFNCMPHMPNQEFNYMPYMSNQEFFMNFHYLPYHGNAINFNQPRFIYRNPFKYCAQSRSHYAYNIPQHPFRPYNWPPRFPSKYI